MASGAQMLELLILAGVAILLIYRLFNVLGEKTGLQNPEDAETVRPFLETGEEKNAQDFQIRSREEVIPAHLKIVISKMKKKDPYFTLKDFLAGATDAFEMILQAYAKGDKEILKKLLTPSLYEIFSASIDDRLKAKQTLETTLVRIESVDILRAELKNSLGTLVVKYVSEQIHLLRDEKGTLLEGEPNQIEQIIDIWTFQRDLRSSDPNWNLVKTKE